MLNPGREARHIRDLVDESAWNRLYLESRILRLNARLRLMQDTWGKRVRTVMCEMVRGAG